MKSLTGKVLIICFLIAIIIFLILKLKYYDFTTKVKNNYEYNSFLTEMMDKIVESNSPKKFVIENALLEGEWSRLHLSYEHPEIIVHEKLYFTEDSILLSNVKQSEYNFWFFLKYLFGLEDYHSSYNYLWQYNDSLIYRVVDDGKITLKQKIRIKYDRIELLEPIIPAFD